MSSRPGASLAYDPKARIVGAIVLVSLAVIFLPMALEAPATPDATAAAVIEIPQKDRKVFVSKITPIPDIQSAAGPREIPSQAAPGKPATVKTAPRRAHVASLAPRPAAPVPAGNQWVVRVGTFSKPENARRLMSRLKQKGFSPRSAKVTTRGEPATRVWIGPFGEPGAARAARARILKETGEQGLVVAQP